MQCVTSGEVANPCFYFLVAYKFPIINVTVDRAELQELTQVHSTQPIRQTSFSIQSGLHPGCTQPPVSDLQNWSVRYCGMFSTMSTQLHNSPYRVTEQKRCPLTHAGVLRRGKMDYVPLRDVCQAAGVRLHWDSRHKIPILYADWLDVKRILKR
ncbi:MAG: hypothetical protein KatS3mg023_2424 [Armatimonadota bacterium]|nr:MAG: hypothetical protein KatS3mg023_2424 [Armatimonadota bacterium]